MGNDPILALLEGSDNFVVMRGARARMLVTKERSDCFIDVTTGEPCDVRTLIMEEAHATKYSVHLGVSKMLYDLRNMNWWPSMRKDIAGGTDGQSERTFQTLENMFRACVRNLVVVGILTFREVSFPTKIVIIQVFDEYSLKVLYGRRGFSVGDHVMMKVSFWKGVVRFGKKGELAPRYIGPFEIPEKIGPVPYLLRLPDELSIGSYLSGVKISSKPEIALFFLKDAEFVSTHILTSKQFLLDELRD
ncbi:putative reverse transcriptase domain-containing protein [Tanacetum coccineum]|uniref:Reverse transcriptase domain-containing protein n=1 Tax=Tanacetum coccineum TaxID=301880 RepID=A0ABQ5BNS2_9ASTR